MKWYKHIDTGKWSRVTPKGNCWATIERKNGRYITSDIDNHLIGKYWSLKSAKAHYKKYSLAVGCI